MQRMSSYGEIVQTYHGQGEITFPRGGRIQSRVTLTHYTNGRYLLACAGRFAPASYPAWEQLEALRDPSLMSRFWKRVIL